ncbi:FAD/NAD(P)-binding oxidoreductase family protein isoform X1 [Carex rostrata]
MDITMASSLVFQTPPPPRNQMFRKIPRVASPLVSCASTSSEAVVVVGGGIAGLAVSLALHRLGVSSLVLEQGRTLRAGGTSLTLFKNGWRVLDSLGVGDELRQDFLPIQGMVMKSDDGRELRSFSFDKEAPGQEVRAVERRVLLETLANKLPPGTISYSSKVQSVKAQEKEGTLLELEDGREILAKTVIGCDGVNSPIAKWMGFSEAKFVGHCAFRGMAIYPDGQPFESSVNYIYGRGLRAGFVPVSPSKVYWFICFNSNSPGQRNTDPSLLKKEALDLVRDFPSDLIDTIRNTEEEIIIKTPLVDRWLWPGLTPPAYRNGVVLVGDAWHPMTPNLGQGACCALEDSVVLATKLSGSIGKGQDAVNQALREYTNERWTRVFPLTVRANLVGSLVQWDNPLVCALRNGVLIPKIVRLGPFLEHTNFECDLLEPVASS